MLPYVKISRGSRQQVVNRGMDFVTVYLYVMGGIIFAASGAVIHSDFGQVSNIIGTALLAVAVLRTERDLTSPVYIVMIVYLLNFPLRQIALALDEAKLLGWRTPPTGPELMFANLLVVAAFAAMMFGYKVNTPIAHRIAKLSKKISTPRETAIGVLVATVAMTAGSLWAIKSIIAAAGGLEKLRQLQSSAQVMLREAGLAHTYYMFTGMSLVAVMLLGYFWHQRQLRLIPLFYMLVMLALCAVLTRREPILFACLGAMAFAGLTGRQPQPAKVIIYGTLGFLASATLLYVRLAAQRQVGGLGDFWIGYTELSEFWVCDMYMTVVRHAGTPVLPWRWGMDMVPRFFDQFIPGVEFSNQALDQQLALQFKNKNYLAGTPPTIIGMLYLNFGVFGVLLGSFIFGLFCRIVSSLRSINASNRPTMNAVLSLTLLDIFVWMITRNADPYFATLTTLKMGVVALFIIIVAKTFSMTKFR